MEPSNQEVPAAADDEISLLDILIVLATYKKLILGGTGLVAVAAVVISLLLPNIYTATTTILPPQQAQSSASAMLGQLVGGGAASALGLKNPNDLYVAMLKSNNVENKLIERFGLVERYDAKMPGDARRVLESRTSVNAGKDGLIAISVSDTDPKAAAEIANAYVDELKRLTRVLAVTEASQRRLFYENEVKKAKDQLIEAELVLKEGLDNNGIVMADAQGAAMIETVARLRAQISSKEIQIGAMETFATRENPELILNQQELASMRRQLLQLEGGVARKERTGRSSTRELAGLENLKRLRDVKYYSALYEILAKQYEISRIDEAKDSTLIQVLDPATMPEHKSGPRRSVIVALSAMAAFVLLILVSFVHHSVKSISRNPESVGRVSALRRAMNWW